MIGATLGAALRSAACLVALAALPASDALAEPFDRGLLWEVDRLGTPPSWVFGTLHSNDARVTALPAPVARAFARARTFAMEIYLSEFEETGFFEAMQFDDGRRLAPLIGEETYARLREALGSAPTLDHTLFVAARERHMMMIGLESLDEQVAALDTIPLETQLALLRHALAHRPELEAEIEPTTRAWLACDLAALVRIDRAAAGG